MRRAAGVAAVLCVAAAGCSSFERIGFGFDTVPPEGTVVAFDRIVLREGIAVGVTASPRDGSGDVMDEDTVVELQSTDPTVLGLAPAERDSSCYWGCSGHEDQGANWHFVLYGVSVGHCSVAVRIDGEAEAEAEIPAEVEEPQAP